MVAEEPHMSHPGGRDQLGNAFHHPEPGAEDRHQGELLSRHLPRRGALQRCLDLYGLRSEVPGHLVGHQHGDFVHQLLEVLDRRGLVPEDRQLVLDKRMLEDRQIGEVGGVHPEKMLAADRLG